MRTGIERRVFQRLQFVGIAELGTHEADAIAMNGTTTTDRDVLRILCPQPQHTFAPVFAEGTLRVDLFVGIGLKRSCSFQMQVDVRLQLQRSGQECMVTRKEHGAPTLL